MRQHLRLACLLAMVVSAGWAQTPVVTHNATKPVAPGDVIEIEAVGQAGASATFRFQRQNRSWPMVETPAGRYRAEYVVRRDDDINNMAVAVSLRLPNGNVLTGSAGNAIGTAAVAAAATPDVEVRSVDMQPNVPVRAGATIRINVDATPNCQVTATAAGLFANLELTERNQGRYTGSWVVPDRRDLSLVQPTCFLRLTRDGRSAVVPVLEFLAVDNVAPVVMATLPFDGEVHPLGLDAIAVAYDDTGGVDLDLAKSQILVDGTNVANGAKALNGWVSCRLGRALNAGRHQISATLTDKAGNTSTTLTTTFTVAETAANVAVTHNATRALSPGDTITVRVTGPAGARVTYSIGNTVSNAPMTERRAGEYQAEYVVRRNENLGNQYVVVNFEHQGRRMQVRSATPVPGDQRTQTLVPPTFTSPANNATVDGPTALRGTATAGARVEITIDSLARVAGFLEMRGDTIKLAAVVNADGQWATAPVAFERPALAGQTTFTIVAVTVQGDKRSEPTTLKILR